MAKPSGEQLNIIVSGGMIGNGSQANPITDRAQAVATIGALIAITTDPIGSRRLVISTGIDYRYNGVIRQVVGFTQGSLTTNLGSWNASTNTPQIVSGVGNAGEFRIVSVGSTSQPIDGINSRLPGDYIRYDASTLSYRKIDNQSSALVQTVADTDTVDLTLTATELTADVKVENLFIRNAGTIASNLTSIVLTNESIAPETFFILYVNRQLALYGRDYTVAGNTISWLPGANYVLLTGYVWEAQYLKGIFVPPVILKFAVANYTSNNVSIIDGTTNLVIATTAVGTEPFGSAFGNNKFVVYNFGSNNVSIIDANTNLVIATTAVGANPYGIAFGNNKFVVANNTSNNISIIDGNTNLVTATTLVGNQPYGVAFGNNKFVVSNIASNTLSIIDANTNLVIATTPVVGPWGVAFGNNKFVVATLSSNSVSIIDGNTNLVTATTPVGSQPYGVAFGNNKFIVSNYNSNNVSIIDANTNLVIATTAVSTPWGVAFGNNKFVVVNINASTISVLDANTNLVIATTPVGTDPFGVSFSS